MKYVYSVIFMLLLTVGCLGQTCALQAGSDIGNQVNLTVVAAPAAGCTISIPASQSCYSFITPIMISSKPIILSGSGPGTCLSYTPASGTAITFSAISSPINYNGQSFGVGLRDITLQGLDAKNPNRGIYLNGVAGFTAFNTNVMQFGTGISFGNNTFILNWEGGSFRGNYTNLMYPDGLTNSGENMSFVNTTFSNGAQSDGTSTGQNCVAILPGAYGQSVEINFVDVSFDGCQVVISNDNAMQIRFVNPHFEDVQTTTLDYPFIKQVSSITYKGTNADYINPMFVIDSRTVTADSFIELNGSSHANIQNPAMFGYGGTSTTPAFVRIQGAGTALLSLTGIPVGNNSSIGSPPYYAPPLYSTDGINTPIVKQ